MSINETDVAVAEYLKDIGVYMSVAYVESTTSGNLQGKLWVCDKFYVTFTTNGREKYEFTTEFFVGDGHRVNRKKARELAHEVKPLYDYDDKHPTIVRLKDSELYVIKPTQAAILYCIESDAQAIDESFYDWCDMGGYDIDSIKARETYDKCCEIGAALRKCLPRGALGHIRTLLQDY